MLNKQIESMYSAASDFKWILDSGTRENEPQVKKKQVVSIGLWKSNSFPKTNSKNWYWNSESKVV